MIVEVPFGGGCRSGARREPQLFEPFLVHAVCCARNGVV